MSFRIKLQPFFSSLIRESDRLQAQLGNRYTVLKIALSEHSGKPVLKPAEDATRLFLRILFSLYFLPLVLHTRSSPQQQFESQ